LTSLSMKYSPLLLLSFILVACSDPQPPINPESVRVFEGGVGKVREIVADGNLAVVVHDEIPGFMTAMTMTFGLREDSVRHAISTGDSISFQVSFDGIDAWISRVKVIH
jgi:Cu/Ag efflux protein CusF